MPDPNPHDMLTRIEILERRVETLERHIPSPTRLHELEQHLTAAILTLETIIRGNYQA
jgi:chaperonin cofactor prefoldin